MPDIFDTRDDDQLDDDEDFDDDEDESGEDGYDGDNPVVDREEERAVNDERSAGGKAPVGEKRRLVALFDERGQMMVMMTVNDRPIEQPRPPTKEEFELIKERGFIVKGGLAATPVPAGIPWKPILIGAAVIAAGAGAYLYVSKKEEEAVENTVRLNPDEDDEYDDGDDGDDDDDDDDGDED